MPAETARVPSPHHEPRRLVLQRQTSITQTIRRYHTILAGPQGGGLEVGIQDPLKYWGWERVKGPFSLSFLLHLNPSHASSSSCSGSYGGHSICLSVPRACTLPSPHPNALAPHSRQVRFGRVHTLPLLGSRAACKALPQRQSLSRSLLRYLRQVLSVLVFSGMCMLCRLLGLLGRLT